MRILMIGVVTLAPWGALAEQSAPASYFVGQFEVIGRDARGPVTDVLRMKEDGNMLLLESCTKGAGTMTFDPLGEGPFAAVTIGDWTLDCQYFNEWNNYPLLACTGAGDTRLTFWPDPAGAGAATMACPP